MTEAAIFFLPAAAGTLPDGVPADIVGAQWAGSLPPIMPVFSHGQRALLVLAPGPKTDYAEALRRQGNEAAQALSKLSVNEVTVHSSLAEDDLVHFITGLALGSYQFSVYKTEQPKARLQVIGCPDLSDARRDALNVELDATFLARDLVNEPVITLTAEELANRAVALGEEAGFSVEVFNEARILSLRMGGLIGVNSGSQAPPTFSVLEYKHPEAKNSQPIILVGKGVVYDTGGLSLKPTPGSMDSMKCDMAGAAAVLAATYAIARLQLPLHVITLIPATDNRPGETAITPGDVITMYGGKTVEVLNTDAEGRLILADALAFAQQYQPQLVIDLATLTGAAMRATGKEAAVYMGTAEPTVAQALEASGHAVGERLVAFPLWEDYEEYMKSDIADLKNIGGADAGAITAGIFLKHFTTYPWLHIDIAGTAFMEKGPWNWRGKGGTGAGVRLLIDFLRKTAE